MPPQSRCSENSGSVSCTWLIVTVLGVSWAVTAELAGAEALLRPREQDDQGERVAALAELGDRRRGQVAVEVRLQDAGEKQCRADGHDRDDGGDEAHRSTASAFPDHLLLLADAVGSDASRGGRSASAASGMTSLSR